MSKKIVSDVHHPLMTNIHFWIRPVWIVGVLAKQRANTAALCERAAVADYHRKKQRVVGRSRMSMLQYSVVFDGITHVCVRADQPDEPFLRWVGNGCHWRGL